MNAYNIEGDFQMGRVRQHFAMQVVGADEDSARERLLTDLGSRHGVKRREVSIDSVVMVSGDDVEAITKKRME